MSYNRNGAPTDVRISGVRRRMAEGLARLVSEAKTCRSIPGLPRRDIPTEGMIWPKPHNVLFDFTATGRGAEWIDEIARETLAVMRNATGPIVVGHHDSCARSRRRALARFFAREPEGQRTVSFRMTGARTQHSRILNPGPNLREDALLSFDQVGDALETRILAAELIAIDGLPCVGKSTLADRLSAQFGLKTPGFDDFYLPEPLWPEDIAPGFPFPFFRVKEFYEAVRALKKAVVSTTLMTGTGAISTL